MINSGDHFSAVAADYHRFRPTYPPELFTFLATLPEQRRLAWDVGTGNGQSACGLAQHFEHVFATDISEEQLSHAESCPNVTYRRASAEYSGLADSCVDLIVAAQSLHWFDLPRFYAEARRVAVPSGLLAAITYGFHRVMPTVDAVLAQLNAEFIGSCWPKNRQHVETGYRELLFPFTEVPAPTLTMTAHWSLVGYLGYLRTWSATGYFIQQHGFDPVTRLADDFAKAWGNPAQERTITWDLHMRIGRLHQPP